ncbi:MAG: class I SAM-dependent methyltransferase [Phycisphaerales bacterium]|nr:class I SAM-dependent methyltransferase [Phycisphaerales bacterium]
MTCNPEYLNPYVEAARTYGGTFDATLWQSKQGQLIRFETFCSIVDFTNQSIVDIGCGLGDFAQYLLDSQIEYTSFHGVDAIPEMVETAKSRHMRDATFSCLDIVPSMDSLPKADWMTCSGTLNAMGEELALTVVESLFERCTNGVAFNFLSNQNSRDPKTESLEPASRFNTTTLLQRAFQMTPLVTFTQAYMDGHDATIVIKKPK